MPGLNDRANIEAFLSAHDPIVEPTLYAIGDEVGVWKIAAFLGRGGSGEVYRVTHRQLGVVAAMKILSRDDSAARDRFRREARILAEHSHPAFPRFLGYGELGDHAYLVIELLEAMPLPNKDREVARYLYKVCEGVSYLHGLGLVHRDIKPQNVLQRGATGQPVLIDLGLVKDTNLSPVHEGVSLSIVDGQARGVGTPKYSAPEQFAGGKISPAADVHALGMLANECFGGNPPRSWERIIRRSTSSIPSQRYSSVAEFVQAIRKRHKINFVILALVPVVFLIVAAIAQLSWHYALQSDGRTVVADTPKLTIQASNVVSSIVTTKPNLPVTPTDPLSEDKVATNLVMKESQEKPNVTDIRKPLKSGQQHRVTSLKDAKNKVFMVSDDDAGHEPLTMRKDGTKDRPTSSVLERERDPKPNLK